MTDETNEENGKKFREMCEKVSALTRLDGGLNGTESSGAQSSAERKTLARQEAILKYAGLGVGPDAPDWDINNHIAAELNPARSAQEQHYTQNLEGILEGIPAGNLERGVLGIHPYEIDEENHDGIVKLHKDFIGYSVMLKEYAGGKDILNKPEEIKIRQRIANRKAKESVESDAVRTNLEFLTDEKKMNVAKALIQWAHYSHAHMESGGDRAGICNEGQNVLKEKETAVYEAIAGAGMSKRDYAVSNLKKAAETAIESGNPEDIQAQIGLAYALGKAA